MKLVKPELHFESPVYFFERLEISFRFGSRLVDIGVLIPDGECNGKPIFLANLESINRHQARINAYRAGLFNAQRGIGKVAA
jgi:hypothetical protein